MRPGLGAASPGGYNSTFSATCTDTLSYKNYIDCRDTKTFLGWEVRKVVWYCNSLQTAGRFRGQQVAELRRSRQPLRSRRHSV